MKEDVNLNELNDIDSKIKESSEIDKMANFLSKLCNMDGTEMGEMWELLDALWQRSDYISKEFRNALKKEIKKEYDYFQENAKIVVPEEKIVQTFKEIRWHYGE